MAESNIWLSNGIIIILSQTENPDHNQCHTIQGEMMHLDLDLSSYCILSLVCAVLTYVFCSSDGRTYILNSSTTFRR
jgi:hypothetical protein